MKDTKRLGPSFCHPERPAFVKSGFCQPCYQAQRRDRLAREEQEELDLAAAGFARIASSIHQPAAETRILPEPELLAEPANLAEAIKMTDSELIRALPEAAVALRKQLRGKAQLRAAEILLSRFVIPTPDGPRRFLSDPQKSERVGGATQVVIGLSVNPEGGKAMQLGKVVGTVQPSLVGEKQPSK